MSHHIVSLLDERSDYSDLLAMLARYTLPLPDAQEMHAWDAAAIKFGLPELLLMENAARAALNALEDWTGPLHGKRIWLLMGGGNNGGDAACLARLLLDANAEPQLISLQPAHTLHGASARHFHLAQAAGVPIIPVEQHDWSTAQPDILVDGLLGTGFVGTLRPSTLELIQHINALRSRAFFLSLDIPSGLNPITGKPCPEAVRANATITFEAAKPGLVLPHAHPFTGMLRVARIGIPRRIREKLSPSCRAIDAAAAALFPAVPCNTHKGMFGHVLIAGGAPGMTGAAHLAARAALRTGCGIISAAAPAAICTEIRCGLPDIMLVPLASAETSHNNTATTAIGWPGTLTSSLQEQLTAYSAMVIGPGMGRTSDGTAFIRALLAAPERPAAVIDADALWHMAQDTTLSTLLRPDDILTPHPGEAARLLHMSSATVQADRRAALTALTERFPCVCVLKGAGTLLRRNDSPCFIAPFDIPNLAVAGSGDIFAGCIGALMAQGADSLMAAVLGVLLHTEAGLYLATRFPERGGLATEIADALPKARARLRGTDSLPPLTKLYNSGE